MANDLQHHEAESQQAEAEQHEAGGGPQPGPETAEFLFEVLQLGHGWVTAAGSCRGRAGGAVAPARPW